MRRSSQALFLALYLSVALAGMSAQLFPPLVHGGTAGASAVVALPDGLFLMADDEESILRVYDAKKAGAPLAEFNFSEFLRVPDSKQEADIEGAASCDGLVFWIGSHGTDKKGVFRLARNCFFATRVLLTNRTAVVIPEGTPYRKLIDDLVADSRYAGFGLNKARYIQPKTPGGLNIEGLACGPAGSLLIGFRGPSIQGRALVVPLLNPGAVVRGAAAQFGEPLLLDLSGKGVRDLTWTGKRWIILAGDVGGGRKPAIYEWPTLQSLPLEIPVKGLDKLNPEGIAGFAGEEHRFLLISDDDRKTGQSTFRSTGLKLD